MKNIWKLLVALCFVAASSCTKDNFSIDDASIVPGGSFYMTVGDFYIIQCSGDPNLAKWTSSDTEIVEVYNGALFAKAPGMANISVRAPHGKPIDFYVVVAAQPVTNFKIPSTLSMFVNSEQFVEVTDIVPETAGKTSIKWSSSDESIFTVAIEKGDVKVSAHKAGQAELIGEGEDITKKCIITVKGPSISLPSSAVAYVNAETTVTVSQEPESYKDYNWSIEQDDDYCSIVPGGATVTLRGKKPGNCKLFLSLDGGNVKLICNITVKPGDLTLDKSEQNLFANEQFTLTATQNPERYSDFEWVSDNNSIATVSGSGKSATVRAGTQSGETVVRCYLNGRALSAECRVKIIGADYLDKLAFVLRLETAKDVWLGDEAYVSPTTADSELRLITIYGTKLPDCFNGRISWNTGTASTDGFSCIMTNSKTYSEREVICSTPVGNMTLKYIQGFRRLLVRPFVYSEFNPKYPTANSWIVTNNFSSWAAYAFKPMYNSIPSSVGELTPVGWSNWSIVEEKDIFFSGVADNETVTTLISYDIEANVDGFDKVRDYYKVAMYTNTKEIVSSGDWTKKGNWLHTNSVASNKTVDGTIKVNGQSFKVHCVVTPNN